jgi:hypothetical protein
MQDSFLPSDAEHSIVLFISSVFALWGDWTTRLLTRTFCLSRGQASGKFIIYFLLVFLDSQEETDRTTVHAAPVVVGRHE